MRRKRKDKPVQLSHVVDGIEQAVEQATAHLRDELQSAHVMIALLIDKQGGSVVIHDHDIDDLPAGTEIRRYPLPRGFKLVTARPEDEAEAA